MTANRKKRGGFSGGRTVTIAFSLCLLAVVTMIGMYTVGRSEQRQSELEQEAKAREQARAEAEARAETEAQAEQEEKENEDAAADTELISETQTASSASAARDWEGEAQAGGAELESEYAEADPAGTGETVILDPAEAAASGSVTAETRELSFSADRDQLLWPVAGNVILDYSMDKTVYFTTLDQYKYNPAVIIQGTLDENVMCAAEGRVTSVETLEETGMTVTMDIGDGYEIVYGQLKELPVKEGDYLKAGETVGYVSEPTRYYTREGCNVYFEVRKDGESIDPMTLLM